MHDESNDDEVIRELLEDCYERIHSGQSVDLDEICLRRPELRDRVAAILENETGLVEANAAKCRRSRSLRIGRLPPGTVLDGFRVVEHLASGGMGDVYVAIQESLGRRVALKVLPPFGADDRNAALRMQREAEITATLDHPNIVPVYAAGTTEHGVFLAMKLLDGRTLDRVDCPDGKRVAAMGAAVARALDAAHAIGVVHRDVKPQNIIVQDGTPYVLDFGLARSRAYETVTREGAVPGTLPYLAPELLRAGGGSDPRSDVYGLGATLYEVLAGRTLFEPEPPALAIRHILLHEPPRLKGVDRDLATIVDRALAKNPRRRFASAAAMAEDLERYQHGLPIASRPSGLLLRSARWARRHPAITSIVSALLLVLLGTAGVLVDARLEEDRRWSETERAIRRDLAGERFRRVHERFAEAYPTLGHRTEFGELYAMAANFESLGFGLARFSTQLPASPDADRISAAQPPAAAHPPSLLAGYESLLAQPEIDRDPRAWFLCGLLAKDVGKVQAAQSYVDRLQTSGRMPRAAAVLQAYVVDEDIRSALDSVGPTPHLSPADRAEDHVLVARAMHFHRPSEEVEDEIRSALEFDRTHVRARLLLAEIRRLQGRADEAYALASGLEDETDLRGSLTIDLVELAIENWGRASHSTSEHARRSIAARWRTRAQQHLDTALAGDPSLIQRSSSLLAAHLTLIDASGDSDRFWEVWHESPFQDDFRHWERGWFRASRDGHKELALEYLDKAIELAPRSRAWIQYRHERLAAAFDAHWDRDLDQAIAAESVRAMSGLVGQWTELAQDARTYGTPAQEIQALTMAGLARIRCEDSAGAFETVSRACDIGVAADRIDFVDGVSRSLVLYAWLVASRVARVHQGFDDPMPTTGPVDRQLLLARERLNRAVHIAVGDATALNGMHYARFWLGYALDDCGEMLEGAARLCADPLSTGEDREYYGAFLRRGLPEFADLVAITEPDALAGTDSGEVAVGRTRAYRWLRTSLDYHRDLLASGRRTERQVGGMCREWVACPELAPIREPGPLGQLDREERDRWDGLWREIRATAAR